MWVVAILLLGLTTTINGQQGWSPWSKVNNDQWSEWERPWDYFRDNVVVRTYYGDVEGFSVPWHIDDEIWDPNEGEYPQWYMRRINCFLGVPYASPPTGRLRFRRPERPRWGGVWDATFYRPACPQTPDEIRRDIPHYPMENITEDCLYMNIYVPNITTSELRPDPRIYPVLVFFHAGDFTHGSAQVHPGHVLATRKVVVVTFNYRLGALGFLTTEDEHGSGNWGMFDQQMALEFIKENIQAFRGDPSRITIMGDGAGSVSVGMHLVSPVSRNKGFYHQAIMMSGTDLSPFGFVRPFWRPREYAEALAKKVNCPTTHTYDMMNCLRDNNTVTWQQIMKAQYEIYPHDGKMGVVWAPTQDGGWYQTWPFLPMTPWDLRQQENFDMVPAIIGLNTHDGSRQAEESVIGLEEGLLDTTFEDYLREMLTDWKILEDYFQRVLEAITFQYTYWPAPSNRTARSQEFINMITDMWFGMPMDEAIKLQCDYQPTYQYQFNYKSWEDWVPKHLGVSHTSQLQYVFGVPFMNETVLNQSQIIPRQWYDWEERNMSDWMMYMWTNFVFDGDPTPNITRNITWEPVNKWNLSYLIIDDHSHIWYQYRQNKYSFWRDYMPMIAQQDYLYPTATPTPEGYVYVITTGSMIALLIVLLVATGILAYMLWSPSAMEDDVPFSDSEVPFTFSTGHAATSMGAVSQAGYDSGGFETKQRSTKAFHSVV